MTRCAQTGDDKEPFSLSLLLEAHGDGARLTAFLSREDADNPEDCASNRTLEHGLLQRIATTLAEPK